MLLFRYVDLSLLLNLFQKPIEFQDLLVSRTREKELLMLESLNQQIK